MRAYSFSQWEAYDDCPQKWKFKSLDKIRMPEVPKPKAERGSMIHDSIAAYINGGKVAVLHPAIAADYVNVFDKYREWPNGDRWTERKFGLTHDWKWTGFESPDVRVRIIPDVIAAHNGEVDCGEWKSGTPKERHRDQRTLYAALGLLWWPQATKIVVTTHYVEGNATSQRSVLVRSSLEKVIKIWDRRWMEMDRNKICAPRPGQYCNWCDYSKRRNGPCTVG